MKLKDTFSKIKKCGIGTRQLVLSGLILFIAVAGYINLNYVEQPNIDEITVVNQPETIPAAAKPAVDEFSEMKIERDKSKSESMAVFREIIDNENSTDEARDKAQSHMTASAKYSECEKMIESLLSAKGFKETIVYISAETVNVIVKTDGLVPTEITQIKDIVIESTGFSADCIKIVEKA